MYVLLIVEVLIIFVSCFMIVCITISLCHISVNDCVGRDVVVVMFLMFCLFVLLVAQLPSTTLTPMLMKILSKDKLDTQRLEEFLIGHLDMLTGPDVSTVLYHCSLKKQPLPSPLLDELLGCLHESQERLLNRQISYLLYSCKTMKEQESHALMLIGTIAGKLSNLDGGAFTPRAIGTSLFGLHLLSNSSREMKSLLRVLTPKIVECKDILSPHSVCTALFGLKRMSAETPEVRRLLKYFAAQLPFVENSFTGQDLTLAICGLEKMDSSYEEVRSVMSALGDKIYENPTAMFCEDGISTCFSSFRNKRMEHSETSYLFEALCMKLNEVHVSPLAGRNVGSLLSSLSGMDLRISVCRDFLCCVTSKIEMSEDFVPDTKSNREWRMSSNDIFLSFSGLKNLSSDHSKVRQLLAVLVDRLNRQDELMRDFNQSEPGRLVDFVESKALASGLFALRNMRNDRNEVNYLLKWIESHLISSTRALQSCDSLRQDEVKKIEKRICFGPSQISLFLYGLHNMHVPARGDDLTCAIKDTYLCRVLAAFHSLLRMTSLTFHSAGKAMLLEQISLAMLGMRGLHGSHPEVDDLVGYIAAEHLHHLQPERMTEFDSSFLSTRMARILYGLHGKLCTGGDGGISFVEKLPEILEHPKLDFRFSPKSFCMSICGLGNINAMTGSGLCSGMSGQREDVGEGDIEDTRLNLLKGIMLRAPSPEFLSGDQYYEDTRMSRHFPSFGLVLQGLSGMGDEHEDVRMALIILSKCLCMLPARADPFEVVLGFNSLSRINSSFHEVRHILEFLNKKMLKFDAARFSFDELSAIMMGMQRMHSTHHNVGQVFGNVTNILSSQENDDRKLAIRHVACILYGLQSSSCSDGVVKNMLKQVAKLIHDAEFVQGGISGRQLIFCLSGMQNMNLGEEEVRRIWCLLLATLENSDFKLTKANVEKSITLLKMRSDNSEKALVEKMERLLNEKAAGL